MHESTRPLVNRLSGLPAEVHAAIPCAQGPGAQADPAGIAAFVLR